MSESVTHPVAYARYPEACGQLLALDHHCSGRMGSTTSLLRGKRGYVVHYHLVDHTISERVLSLDAGDAEYLFGRLRVQLVSGKAAFE